MIVNIDPKTNATVSASDVCQAALARKEAYAQELLAIAQREKNGAARPPDEPQNGRNLRPLNGASHS